MSRIWEPERVVDEQEASRLIGEHFPDLKPARARLEGQGFDNTVFLVNDRYIFRFPRRRVAVPLIKTETQLLGKLSKALPLPVPNPEFFAGRASDDFPWPFMGYLRLPGRTACGLDLSDEQRLAMAEPLAQFMQALHSLPVNDLRPFGIGLDPIGRYDFETRIGKVLPLLEEARECGLITRETVEVLTRSLADAQKLGEPEASTVVHGDLYARHLLVDDSGLSGIIDWGDVHIGTPATDLALVHSFLPEKGRKRFLDIYGQVPEHILELARFRAICHISYAIIYAHHENDAALLREGLYCISNLALR